MFSKRPAFTTRAISAAGASIALCLAMSGASAEARSLSVSEVHASQVSEVLTYEPQTEPHADGIIAILIGAIGTNDDRRGQTEEKVAAPAPPTAPLGSAKGSFVDGSVVYGSDLRISAGSSGLPYIEQDN